MFPFIFCFELAQHHENAEVVTMKPGRAAGWPREKREDEGRKYFESYDEWVFSVEPSPCLTESRSAGRHSFTYSSRRNRLTRSQGGIPYTASQERPLTLPHGVANVQTHLSHSGVNGRPVGYGQQLPQHEDSQPALADPFVSPSNEPPSILSRSESRPAVQTSMVNQSESRTSMPVNVPSSVPSSVLLTGPAAASVTAAIAITSTTSAAMTTVGTTASTGTSTTSTPVLPSDIGPSGGQMSMHRLSTAPIPSRLPVPRGTSESKIKYKKSNVHFSLVIVNTLLLTLIHFYSLKVYLNPFQPLLNEGPGGLESGLDSYSSSRRRWSHLFHTSIYHTVGTRTFIITFVSCPLFNYLNYFIKRT